MTSLADIGWRPLQNSLIVLLAKLVMGSTGLPEVPQGHLALDAAGDHHAGGWQAD